MSGTKKKGKRLASFLDGSILFKDMTRSKFSILFIITAMIMALIYCTYQHEEYNREIARNKRELNDLHTEYTLLKSAIMQNSKQSVLSERLKATGLKEPLEPVKRIAVGIDEEEPAKQSNSHEQ